MDNRPKPTGKYAVGTITYSLYDGRKIACRVYYPVNKDQTEGFKKPAYFSPEMTKSLSKTLSFPISYKKIEKSGTNFMECYEDAPCEDGKFPLIVFSHGAGSYMESNSFMCIEMASHGYVVIAVAHPGMAACVEYDDGTFEYAPKDLLKKTYDPYWKGVKALMKLMKAKGTDEELAAKHDEFQKTYCKFLNENLLLWMEDTRRAVSYAKDNLDQMIDFGKGIGVTGHSFGGITAYALCQSDKDFTCGINIDGLTIGDYEGKILDKPFMQISCAQNLNVETRVLLYHTAPVYKVVFKDMQHLGFTDMKHAIPIKAVTGRLPDDVMHDALCKCHLEFFDTYLKKSKDKPELVSSDKVTIDVL